MMYDNEVSLSVHLTIVTMTDSLIQAGLKKPMKTSLSFWQAFLTFCFLGTTSCSS